MIRSAVMRLALSYLAIIMVLSIGFSVALYHTSDSEFNRSLHRQGIFFGPSLQTPPRRNPLSFNQFRQKELAEGEHHLLQNLILFNLATLILGSAASVLLARRTLQPIEEAMDSQSRFTADASHELRTPLTAMQTEIEVALRDPKLTKAEAAALLASNLEEVAKLRALSEGLLRLARQDGSKLPTAAVRLGEVVPEAGRRVAVALQAKQITLSQDIAGLTVQGDRASLVELVVILLDNAIKYSQPATTIRVAADRHGRFARLTVSDQGHGIKASDLPHIFDRFYRSDPSRSKEKIEGYGLGLSIAHKIADLHHGSIEAQSTPGEGSTFTVRLPLAEQA